MNKAEGGKNIERSMAGVPALFAPGHKFRPGLEVEGEADGVLDLLNGGRIKAAAPDGQLVKAGGADGLDIGVRLELEPGDAGHGDFVSAGGGIVW